jgi:hypothetical protein
MRTYLEVVESLVQRLLSQPLDLLVRVSYWSDMLQGERRGHTEPSNTGGVSGISPLLDLSLPLLLSCLLGFQHSKSLIFGDRIRNISPRHSLDVSTISSTQNFQKNMGHTLLVRNRRSTSIGAFLGL